MSKKINIAVDAMGGDNSPKKIIDGISISLKKYSDNFFFLFGDKVLLNKEISKNKLLEKNCEVIAATDIIPDDESPLAAAKKGKNSSMWKAIESTKNKKTNITLSAGNTGALLVISRILLPAINGISKPGLAALWPNQNDMSVVLDLGANVECNEKNLVDFSCMGISLFKSLFDKDKPKIALLNIGSEEIKGSDMLKKTFTILKKNDGINFEFDGYIEGNHIMDGKIDVIITDGFTGNIALKTAEGTANFITKNFKKSLNPISLLFSYRSLSRFKKKLDPRKYNGAILLGLESPVVKSHGGTDALGFANSISVCNKIVKNNLIEKIKSNLITIDA